MAILRAIVGCSLKNWTPSSAAAAVVVGRVARQGAVLHCQGASVKNATAEPLQAGGRVSDQGTALHRQRASVGDSTAVASGPAVGNRQPGQRHGCAGKNVEGPELVAVAIDAQ